MKIAHINLQNYLYVGIEKKIIEQANASFKSKLNIDYFILNNVKEHKENNLIYKKLIYPKNNILKKITQRFFKFSIWNKSLDLDEYDVIVIRYPRPIPYDWKKLVNRYKGKLITEHHAIALPETIQEITFGSILNYIQEYINSKKLKTHLIGLVGVTDEITYEESKRNSEIETETISNGINVSEVTFTKFKPFDKKSLTMTIVASEYAPWHGLDKLLHALLNYKTELCITLNVVGEYISELDKADIKKINSLKSNIKINTLGAKRGIELDEIFSKSNLAIGSLAIYRQKLQEACALKVREYLARGIPFIYSAKDPDILKDAPFALQLANDISSIDMNEIIIFLDKISNIKNISKEMREYAYKNVDWSIKIRQLHDFICRVKQK